MGFGSYSITTDDFYDTIEMLHSALSGILSDDTILAKENPS